MASFASVPTLANYLTSGYWAFANYDGNQPRHWASTTITVNISALTAAEQFLATSALNMWATVAPLTFLFTNGPANITYNHNGSGYVANTSDTTPVSGQNYQAETIDISTTWFNNDGGAGDGRTGIDSYDFQTYLHETGHALGLGHQGPYNNSATYGTNNIYTNDTWQYSIMSYFSQNNYGGSSYDYVISPEMADIYAIQQIYGVRNSTGGLTYGFHSTAGSIYDFGTYAGLGTPAFTIYNNAYNNTLDASGYSADQVLDATPGDWSSIGGYTNNIGTYLTTHINNLIGGTGNDLIIPNGSLIGTLTGGGGNDTFQGTTFGLSAYTITDMNFGDKLNFTNTNLGSFSYTRSGSSMVYAGGSLTLSNNAIGHFIESNDTTYGGIDLKLVQPTATSDFSDRGRSDILWRNANGALADWSMNGATITNSQSLNAAPDPSWSLADIADFNGDGHSDILWRNANGTLVDWSMNGAAIASSQVLSAAPDASWTIAGVGDLNADHSADILWRNANGALAEWTMNGGTIVGSQAINAAPDASWSVAGMGDFDGNGRADVLWRNANGTLVDWSMNGAAIANSQVLNAAPDASWTIAGIGDFNGNGNSDILWRNSNGTLAEWMMNGGSIVSSQAIAAAPDASWSIVQIGDFDGNGRSDILWRQNATGIMAEWQMNGGSIVSSQYLQAAPDATWHTQSHPTIAAV